MKAGMAAFIVLLVSLTGIAQAQSTTSSWQTLTSGTVSVRVPRDWLVETTFNSASATSPSGAHLMLGAALADSSTPLAALVEQLIASSGYEEVLGSEPVELPAGTAQRITARATVGDQQAQVVQYALRVPAALVTLTGVASSDDVATLILVDHIANTLTIADTDTGWTRCADNTGRLVVRAPADWEQVQTGNNILTVVARNQQAVITLNYRPLDQAMTLEEAAQYLLDWYTEQGMTIAGFDTVNLPVGDAYRALLVNVPAQGTAGETIQTQQYQYIVLLDNMLLLINVGTTIEQFEAHRSLFEQLVDTIEVAL